MPLEPRFGFARELYHLRETVVATQIWPALVAAPDAELPALHTLADADTSDRTAARDRVIYGAFDAEAPDHAPPACIVRAMSGADLRRMSTTDAEGDSPLYLGLELVVPDPYQDDIQNAHIWIFDVAARLVREMVDLAGQHNLLAIDAINRGAVGIVHPEDTHAGKLTAAAEFTVTVTD